MKTELSKYRSYGKLRNILRGPHSREQEKADKELEDVMISSALLQVSEFRFFQLSYAYWYGRNIQDTQLEPFFAEYMFNSFVPHWVRQMTRRILLLHEEGRLDPQDFNIVRPQVTPEMRALGEWYIIMLLFIVVIFCVLISGYPPF
jgi:hypothetical protein